MRALSIKARKGDLEALRAIELHEKGGWEMVIKEHYNPKRNSNLDLWKWYLKEENLEYAQDPFWQDLVWDIPVSYLQERGNFGIGKIAALKPGVLDKLRDDVEFENIDLPKAYRKLVQQLADSSEEDLPREWNNKTWVYLPSMEEDPKNYDTNVRKLEDLVAREINKRNEKGESYLKNSPYWILLEHKKAKVVIRINNENKKLELTSDIWGKENIPERYINDVLEHVQEVKMHGAELLIAEYEKDPHKQIEIAKSGDVEVLQALARNKQLTPEAQISLANIEDVKTREILALNQCISPEAQVILARSNNPTIRGRLAMNESLIPEAEVILAQSNEELTLLRLAYKEKLTKEAQVTLVKSKDRRILCALASKPMIDEEVQEALAKSDHQEVQEAIAGNSSITPKVQLTLVESKSRDVHRKLALNKSITKKIQFILLKSEDIVTRACLAVNESILPKVQRLLAKSNDPYVLSRLAQNKRIIYEVQKTLAESNNPEVQQQLIVYQNLNPELQAYLAESENEKVQLCLVGLEKLADEAQVILSKSKHKNTLIELTKRKTLCPEAQIALAKIADEELRYFLLLNRNHKEAEKILESPGYSLQESKKDAGCSGSAPTGKIWLRH
jgi:hypothetical protein